jgi:hypothetical protein
VGVETIPAAQRIETNDGLRDSKMELRDCGELDEQVVFFRTTLRRNPPIKVNGKSDTSEGSPRTDRNKRRDTATERNEV